MAKNGKAGYCVRWLAMGMLVGCAGLGQTGKAANANGDAGANEDHAAAAPASAAVKGTEEPSELDRMLDAKPIALAAVKPANAGSAVAGSPSAVAAKAPDAAPAGKGKFRLQIGAESDVDEAQAKKAEYERKLGGTVDMVFDAPYYKLRWGNFETKQDAEDKILELSDQKIQAFVIKN